MPPPAPTSPTPPRPPPPHPPLAVLRRRLGEVGQEHVLRFYDELTDEQRRSLLAQVASLDLEAVPDLVERYVKNKPRFDLPADLRPAPYYPNDPAAPGRTWDKASYRSKGEGLLREGKVAAFTVAGGQGSRLGYDSPKGCLAAGAVTGKPLFAIFAETLLAGARRFGRPIPWYIMTSPLNHEPTAAFFREHANFGIDGTNVRFFPQGVMPSLDARTGRILLAAKGELATNPDGHGGSIKALHASGALADMQHRGVEHISYFQVDNPLVALIDPVFLGLHAFAPDSSSQMSSKMIPKVYPEERLGVFCSVGGRTEVIEYSDLPMELQRQRLPDGSLRFPAGSIAVHAMSVAFVHRLNTDASFSLPYHRAEKRVACIDPDTGAPIEPAAANAVKLERFVFDALPLCDRSIVYETDRIEEFAPIKNASGVDSVASSRQVQTLRAARWLEAAGVKVPRKPDGTPDCTLEISPRTALFAEELMGCPLPREIERGAALAL